MRWSGAALPPSSQVMVKQLILVQRPYHGSPGVMRPPQVGDTGTIVHVTLSRVDDSLVYIVENATSDGKTVWLADFSAEELAPIAGVEGSM